jgi:hypothetical protein
MASDNKAPAVISIHTPSSSLALVHSGMIIQVLHTSPSHPFTSYRRRSDVALRQAQQKTKYRILWETRWAWVAEI